MDETVVSLLKEGIVSICNTCKSLLDAQVCATNRPNYEQIWRYIIHAEQCLEKSRTMIEERQNDLAQRIEKLVKEKENAEQQNTENASDKSKEIQKQKARHDTGAGVTIGGAAALLAIPFIGIIPGIVMLSVGTSELVKASNALREAEQERDKEIEELKQNLQLTSDIQEVVRRAVHLLNIIRGKVNEMENHCQSFIRWEPVIIAMEDVLKATKNVAENPLVCGENVLGLINNLQESVEEILALIHA